MKTNNINSLLFITVLIVEDKPSLDNKLEQINNITIDVQYV